MNKLIWNEWVKLFSRKRVVVIILLTMLSGLISVAVVKVSDQNNRISWQESYQEEIDMYNRQLSRYPQFDADEWENETSYNADLMKWRNQIQKYQFCLDNQIASWDWRMEVLEEYFNNLLLMDGVRAGWNSEDLNTYFGFALDVDLTKIEETNENLMIYVLNNDYLTYNKEQLQLAEENLLKLQEKPWIEDADKTIALAQNDVDMWERYVGYNTAPFAKDNWVSVAIERIHDHQELYIHYTHLSPEDPAMQPERAEELQSRLDNYQAAIAEDLFALENQAVSYDIKKDVYTENSPYLNFLDLSVWSSAVLVLLGIVLGTIMIASEYRYQTIKQLTIYPYKRKTILGAKFHSIGLLLAVLCLLMFGINLALGFLLFPSKGAMPIFTAYFNNTVYWIPYIVYVLIEYLFVLLQALVMVTLAVMLAVITRSASISMAVSLFAYLAFPALLKMAYPYLGSPAILKYVLFGNLDLGQYLNSSVTVPYAPLWVSVLVIAAWWFIMRRIAYGVFKKREIRE